MDFCHPMYSSCTVQIFESLTTAGGGCKSTTLSVGDVTVGYSNNNGKKKQ